MMLEASAVEEPSDKRMLPLAAMAISAICAAGLACIPSAFTTEARRETEYCVSKFKRLSSENFYPCLYLLL